MKKEKRDVIKQSHEVYISLKWIGIPNHFLQTEEEKKV